MIFMVYEPYNDIFYVKPDFYVKSDAKLDECFICLQLKIEDEEITIKLTEQTFYINECTCNSSVHKLCLKKWVDRYYSCPICRKKITQEINNDYSLSDLFLRKILLYNLSYPHNNYSIIILIMRFLAFIVFLYSSLDFYFLIIKNRSNFSEQFYSENIDHTHNIVEIQ